MRNRRLAAALVTGAVFAATAVTSSGAMMMHPHLGADLMGMGDHGTVNLQVTAKSGKVCWSFNLPKVTGITKTSIHAGANGAQLIELGMHYAKSGCETVSAMTLEHLEATPARYYIWVDTPGHPGDLRGKLFAGMAHM